MTSLTATQEVFGLTELAEHILLCVPVKDLVVNVLRVCRNWLAHTRNSMLQEKLFLRTEKPKAQDDRKVRGDGLNGLEPLSTKLVERSNAKDAGDISPESMDNEDLDWDKPVDPEEPPTTQEELPRTDLGEVVSRPAEPHIWSAVGVFGARTLLRGPISYASRTEVSFNPLLLQEMTLAERTSMTDQELAKQRYEVVHPPVSQPQNAGFNMLLLQPAQSQIHVIVEVTFEIRQRWQTWWENFEVEVCLQESSGIRIGHLMEVIERVVDGVEDSVHHMVQREPYFTTVEDLLTAVAVVDHSMVIDTDYGYEFTA